MLPRKFLNRLRPAVLGSALIESCALIITLGLLIYGFNIALLKTEDGMSWNAGFHVTNCTPGGPAAAAGIEVGDHLLKIDGIPIDSWSLPILDWKPDRPVLVSLKRNGRQYDLQLQMAAMTPLQRMDALAPLLIALSFWFFSLLMPGWVRQRTETRLFRALLIITCATLTAGNLSGMGLVWAGYLFGILLCLQSPLTLHFHITLPGLWFNRHRRLILGSSYLLSAVLALPYLLIGPIAATWRAEWSWTNRLSLGLSILGSLGWLSYSYIRTPYPHIRRRLRLLVLGTGLALVPLLLLSLLPQTMELSFVPYPFTMIFLILIPLTYWYAVTHYDLLRVDMVLNRSLVYLLSGLIPIAGYLLGARPFNRWIAATDIPAEPIYILEIALAGILIGPLHSLLRRLVDRTFYGKWYDYRSVISEVSRSLNGTLDRHTIESLLLERLGDTLWIGGAALYLSTIDDDSQLIGHQHGELNLDAHQLRLQNNTPLLRYLYRRHQPLETYQLQEATQKLVLNPAEKALVESHAVRWWAPLVGENQLLGLLLLGSRVGNERFSDEDLRILNTLCDQAALAVKNVLLVEALQRQLDEVRQSRQLLAQSNQKLLHGREMERKHLARELHDGPIQDLIAIRYQIGASLPHVADPEIQETLNSARDATGELLAELRGICTQLRPPLLDAFGLASAIAALCDELNDRHGLEITPHLAEIEKLPEEISLLTFRICQEALNNTVKHARATKIDIRLYQTQNTLHMEIQDDGVGFILPESMDDLMTEGHFGLLGIRERIELVKGRLDLQSAPGEGASLQIHIPLQ